MKNALKRIGKRAPHMEEKISKLKDRNIEVNQVEEERKLRFEKMVDICENNITPLERAT